MKSIIYGYHSREYIALVASYAERLNATGCIIRKSGAIDLYNNNDCICLNYKPTTKELNK